jgi:hypothetical protein
MSKTVTNFLDAIETPSDINEHLVALYSLAGRCHSVVELGVRYALSSTALIAARPDSLKSYDIELSPEALRIFKDGEKDGVNCQLIQSSSFDVTLYDGIDMLFIDTDHTYDCLSRELALHGNKPSKYLIFHDTVSYASQLLPAINQFLNSNSHWQVLKHFEHNNGLLVLSRG